MNMKKLKRSVHNESLFYVIRLLNKLILRERSYDTDSLLYDTIC